jgi:ATP-dependent exoDNAse (exonuclease V) beta subunit
VSGTTDQAAREQIRDDHGHTMFVEAGAGTGKTTTLVGRIIAMVVAGTARLSNVAAITFTEAAAAELKDRVRVGLEQVAADDAASADAHERARAALDDLDDAAISTLHAFAQRILTAYPLEAGLPPGFDVADDIAATLAFEARWSAFLDELLADDALHEVLVAAFALGLKLRHLRTLARELHDHHDRLTAAPHVDATVSTLPAVDVTGILGPLDATFDLLPTCRDAEDLLAGHVRGLVRFRDRLRDTSEPLAVLELLADAPKLASKNGRAENWPNGCKTDVVTYLKQAQDALTDTLARTRARLVGPLVARVVNFTLRSADERRRDGMLEFHDLLVLARDLVLREPAVRAALAARFTRVLVDEFQDTDPLQADLALLLTGSQPADGADGRTPVPVPVDADALTPGALFVVGDPKQSIYRFRRADMGVYLRFRAGLGDEPTLLVENHRCVPAIVAFVNHVFEQRFTDAAPGTQAPWVPLTARRDPLPGAPSPVQVFGAERDARVDEVRRDEARDVAALVGRVATEQWTVDDPVTHTQRTARYGDVAILLPTRTSLPAIEAALDDAGIPSRVESQSLVYSTAEVRDLVTTLTAIDDPTDAIAVVGALRTPAFACPDDELVEYHLAHGPWDYRRRPPDELREHTVTRALGALRELHRDRWTTSVSGLLDRIVRERHVLELALAYPRPRDHWRRVRFLVDRARAFDAAGGSDVRAFVDWVEEQASEQARAVEVVVPEPDDDAVRITTVHASKGLEYPIVLLAGLNTRDDDRLPSALWGDAGLEVRLGPKDHAFETAGYEAARATERDATAAERDRLLYVAVTRARDHLLVSLHRANGASNAARLAACVDDGPCERVDPGPPRAGRAVAARTARDGGDGGGPDVIAYVVAAWQARREALLARAADPVVSATGISHRLAARRQGDRPDGEARVDENHVADEDVVAGEDDVLPVRRGRSGTAVGRAVHAVLQTVDLRTGDGLRTAARAQALAEEVPEREAEVARLARAMLDAPVVRLAAHNPCWREVPVTAQVGDVTVEGVIDLLVDAPEGLVVVDYKTDRVETGPALERAVARHRPQGAAYALALGTLLGRPVSRCAFVFAAAGGVVERDVADLDDAIVEVRESLSSV